MKIFVFFYFNFLWNKNKEVEYDILSINDFVNIINNLGYNKTDYDKIILNLKSFKWLLCIYKYNKIKKNKY